MNKGLSLKTRLSKLLHIKPHPLRHGNNGTFIFIHINKTAGTSVGNAIGLPIKHHQTAREVIAKIGREKWNRAYKFTLVRNPWDKVVSHYEYRRKKNKNDLSEREIPFNEWVKKTYGPDKDPFYYDNEKAFQPQIEWLKDDEGNISIDFVGKFETIDEDFERIKSTIGISAELPHLNASKRAGYRSYYDDQTREIVAQWFREDIETFDYQF
ncbi:MAG: sulfotransferase family 2 domain-containing protein [Lysobacterales bacterium]